ncbi:hypothetical protein CBL_20447 [Carabus blaptoides fortunei]
MTTLRERLRAATAFVNADGNNAAKLDRATAYGLQPIFEDFAVALHYEAYEGRLAQRWWGRKGRVGQCSFRRVWVYPRDLPGVLGGSGAEHKSGKRKEVVDPA